MSLCYLLLLAPRCFHGTCRTSNLCCYFGTLAVLDTVITLTIPGSTGGAGVADSAAAAADDDDDNDCDSGGDARLSSSAPCHS